MAKVASIRLVPLSSEQASDSASWFVGDDEGQRRFGGFYGVHPKWWDLVCTDRCRHGWIAFVEGDAVGFVDIEAAPECPAKLVVYLRPERRHQGLGVPLITAALAEARRLGAKRVSAAVEPDNAVSLKSCLRAGFHDAGTNDFGERLLLHDLA